MKKFISIILLISSMFVGFNANSAGKVQSVQGCTSEMVWYTFGTGALYGGGVMLVGSTLEIALAPTGAIAAPVATVAGNTILGGLLGGGSSLFSYSQVQKKTGINSIHIYCVQKYTKETAEQAIKSSEKFFMDLSKKFM